MTGKQLRRLLPPDIISALETTGIPWCVEHCKRHFRLRVDGRVIAVLSLGGTKEHTGAYDNLRSSVKRVLRGLNNGI